MPCPTWDDTRTVPRTRLTMSCTTSRPTPRPEMSVTVPFVEKPGRNRNSSSSASLSRSAASRVDQASRDDCSRAASPRRRRRHRLTTMIWSMPAL